MGKRGADVSARNIMLALIFFLSTRINSQVSYGLPILKNVYCWWTLLHCCIHVCSSLFSQMITALKGIAMIIDHGLQPMTKGHVKIAYIWNIYYSCMNFSQEHQCKDIKKLDGLYWLKQTLPVLWIKLNYLTKSTSFKTHHVILP